MLAAMMVVHIGMGALGLLSGVAAFAFKKGSESHRWAGRVFVVSMLLMSGLAVPLAVLAPDPRSGVAGGLTFYLVLTGWMTVKRAPRELGWPEWAACVIGVAVAIGGVVYGIQALNPPPGFVDDLPPQPIFVFAGLALLGVLLDLSRQARAPVIGAARLSRHLWRLGTALVIAAAAFFLGQQQALPEQVRGTIWVVVPVLSVLIWMVGWLVRIRIPRRPAKVVGAA